MSKFRRTANPNALGSLAPRVYALVRAVPAGKVTTYGQLGAMCGVSDYRLVGEAMNAAPNDVPWQRVINARGEISIPGATGARQRALLEQEGVEFDRSGRVDLTKYGWEPNSVWLTENGYHVPPRLDNPKTERPPTGEQLNLF